jgi:glyceraldehyde 3-phosphate dehydrogenase
MCNCFRWIACNIAINGMGRIGRMVLRIALHNENFNVVAINASYPPDFPW